jgi:acetyltransferase-like isoleucine patch superfamily enzyme
MIFNKLIKKGHIIGNYLWIEFGSLIIRWVRILDGEEIRANSFVNKDVHPFSIFSRFSVKIIRYGLNYNQIQKIQNLKLLTFNQKNAKKVLVELNIPSSVFN